MEETARGSRTSSWLGTLLPLTTFLGANLPISFLGEIKISAGFCNPIPNPIWKNQAHAAWQPELGGLGLAGPGVMGARTSNIGTGSAFPFLLQGSLECEQPRGGGGGGRGGVAVGSGIWWKEALVRPEASSVRTCCVTLSHCSSSLGLNLPICEVGGAVFHGPHAPESLKGCVFKMPIFDAFPRCLKVFLSLQVVLVT